MCRTSSHFGRVCKATERTDVYKLAWELISQTNFHSAATDHGLSTNLLPLKNLRSRLDCKQRHPGSSAQDNCAPTIAHRQLREHSIIYVRVRIGLTQTLM